MVQNSEKIIFCIVGLLSHLSFLVQGFCPAGLLSVPPFIFTLLTFLCCNRPKYMYINKSKPQCQAYLEKYFKAFPLCPKTNWQPWLVLTEDSRTTHSVVGIHLNLDGDLWTTIIISNKLVGKG